MAGDGSAETEVGDAADQGSFATACGVGAEPECDSGGRQAGALDGAGLSGASGGGRAGRRGGGGVVGRGAGGGAVSPPSAAGRRALPDWAAVDQELRRHKHVTRKLLWMEYKTAHPDGFGFSQFKLRLSEWQKASGRGLSMRQVHHAGETVQVDYAGDTVAVMDDGAARAAQIFVACLPCSGLIYAEASWTQATEDWLAAHVRLFAFLGGVPAKVVPDNLKVGVTHASYYDPVINASYAGADQALRHGRGPGAGAKAARQAGGRKWRVAGLSLAAGAAASSAVLLAGRAEPGDRAAAGRAERQADGAAARGQPAQLCSKRSNAPRSSRLPIEPYVVGQWAIGATVNVDYHVAVERNFYSVPHALVRKRVDVFVTPTARADLPSRRAGGQPRPAGRAKSLGDAGRAHAAGAQRGGQADAGLGARPGGQASAWPPPPMSSGC